MQLVWWYLCVGTAFHRTGGRPMCFLFTEIEGDTNSCDIDSSGMGVGISIVLEVGHGLNGKFSILLVWFMFCLPFRKLTHKTLSCGGTFVVCAPQHVIRRA